MFLPPCNNIAPTTDGKALVKLRVNIINLWSRETGTDRTNLLATKGYAQFVIPMKCRGTQREYSSKPLKDNIVERILVFKR